MKTWQILGLFLITITFTTNQHVFAQNPACEILVEKDDYDVLVCASKDDPWKIFNHPLLAGGLITGVAIPLYLYFKGNRDKSRDRHRLQFEQELNIKRDLIEKVTRLYGETMILILALKIDSRHFEREDNLLQQKSRNTLNTLYEILAYVKTYPPDVEQEVSKLERKIAKLEADYAKAKNEIEEKKEGLRKRWAGYYPKLFTERHVIDSLIKLYFNKFRLNLMMHNVITAAEDLTLYWITDDAQVKQGKIQSMQESLCIDLSCDKDGNKNSNDKIADEVEDHITSSWYGVVESLNDSWNFLLIPEK